MKTLDTTPDAAEDLLVKIAGHVPADVVIGRPVLVTPDTVVIAGNPHETAWALEDDGTVSRLASLDDDGTAELTFFYRGRETRRVVRRLE
jgi:hypothetical protein